MEITGNVADSERPGAPVVVFVYDRAAEGLDPAAVAPLSVATLDAERKFAASDISAETVSVVFLADTRNDGVVDPTDPVAILADSAHLLRDLHPGDRITLSDVRLEFSTRRALAGRLEITRAATSAPTPTPPPA